LAVPDRLWTVAQLMKGLQLSVVAENVMDDRSTWDEEYAGQVHPEQSPGEGFPVAEGCFEPAGS